MGSPDIELPNQPNMGFTKIPPKFAQQLPGFLSPLSSAEIAKRRESGRKPGDTNIVDYARHEKHTFWQKPLSRVDSLILSQLAYLKWKNIPAVPSEIEYPDPPLMRSLCTLDDFRKILDKGLDYEKKFGLMSLIYVSPRWKNMRIINHTDEFDASADKQFSATTFLLPDGTIYVSFRGTDSTIVGWKEDFMLAFEDPIPSQARAAEYLEQIASATSVRAGLAHAGHDHEGLARESLYEHDAVGAYSSSSASLPGVPGEINSGTFSESPSPIVVGGHSKGGNLAVYAAAACSEQARSRLRAVYSHDGPGFSQETMDRVNISKILPIMDKTVPGGSTIGMLLGDPSRYKIVRSNEVGFYQHDAYSWIVKDGDFEYLDTLDESAKFFNTTMANWISGLSKEQMRTFTDVLFGMFGANGSPNIQTPMDLPSATEYLNKLDPEMRGMFLEVMGRFFRASAQEASTNVRGAASEAREAASEAAEDVGRRISEAREQAADAMEDAAENIGNKLEDAVSNVGAAVEDAVENIGENIGDAVENAMENAAENRKALGDKIHLPIPLPAVPEPRTTEDDSAS